MFSRVVGFGAQAVVLELKDPSKFASLWQQPQLNSEGDAFHPAPLTSSTAPPFPEIHKAQLLSRGLVAKVMQCGDWTEWFVSHHVPLASATNRDEEANRSDSSRPLSSISSSGLYSLTQLVPSTPTELSRVTACARRIASLRSNFVISYISVAATPTELRILMPRYSMTLQEWARLHLRELKEVHVLKIAYQLALGLIDLSEEGIFHLDFHGGNVFVANSTSMEPHCVIADVEASFYDGISTEVPAAFTEPFAAPERACVAASLPSNAQSIDMSVFERTLGKCDVWSLGLVLFSIAAQQEFPGLAEETADLGSIFMNHPLLTPTRIASIVRQDLTTNVLRKGGAAAYSDGFISLVTMMLNHDPLTRPSLYVVLDALQALLDVCEGRTQTEPTGLHHPGYDDASSSSLGFPFCLGPFALHSIADPSQVALYPQSGMFDIHATCFKCGLVRSSSRRARTDCTDASMHLPSHCSDAWSHEARLLPCVDNDPSSRWSMVFLYPVACDAPASHRALAAWKSFEGSNDASRSNMAVASLLQLQGGFAVIDKTQARAPEAGPVQVMTVLPVHSGAPPHAVDGKRNAPVLHFAAAQPWPSCCTDALRQAGRIHAEVPSLLGTTAKCFSWLLPREVFVLPNGEPWTPAPFGGFVFWFDAAARHPSDMDRYFPLCEMTPPELPQGPSRSKPLLSQIAGALGTVGRALYGSFSTASLPGAAPASVALSALTPSSIGGDSTASTPPLGTTDPQLLVAPPSTSEAALPERTPAGRLRFHELDVVTPTPQQARCTSSQRIAAAAALMPRVDSALERSSHPLQVSGPPSQVVTAAPSTATSANVSRENSAQQAAHHIRITLRGSQDGVVRQSNDMASLRHSSSTLGGSAGGEVSTRAASLHEPPRASSTASSHLSNILVGTNGHASSPDVMPPTSDVTQQPTIDYPRQAAMLHHTPSPVAVSSNGTSPSPAIPIFAQRSLSIDTPFMEPPSHQIPPRGHAVAGGGWPAPTMSSMPTSATSSVIGNHHLTDHDDGFGPHLRTIGTAGGSDPRGSFWHGTRNNSWHQALADGDLADLHQYVAHSTAPVPVLMAALRYPLIRGGVHVHDGGLSGKRFHVLSTSEYGSCGPLVHVSFLPVLMQRLGITPSQHPDVVYVSFCAVDAPPAPPTLSQVGPGGASAAATLRGREALLQHHGLIFFDSQLQPTGIAAFLISFRGGMQSSTSFGGYRNISAALRGLVQQGHIANLLPFGQFGEYDPFLAAPWHLLVAVPSTVPVQQSLHSMEPVAQVSSRTIGELHRFHTTEMRKASSYAMTSAGGAPHTTTITHHGGSGDAYGRAEWLAMDLQRGAMYLADSSCKVWLEFAIN